MYKRQVYLDITNVNVDCENRNNKTDLTQSVHSDTVLDTNNENISKNPSQNINSPCDVLSPDTSKTQNEEKHLSLIHI